MGFFDKIKKTAKDVTGIGLSADEQYARAYSKGVFLQPPNYKSASKNFFEAQGKYQDEGNDRMAFRSFINGILYDFYYNHDVNSIDTIITNLEKIGEIERIGSDTEMVSTPTLVNELLGYKSETKAKNATDLSKKAFHFRKAGDHYLSLGKEKFTFIESFKLEGPLDNGISRGYFLLAMADYHEAMLNVLDDPGNAQNIMHRSLTGFKRSQDHEWTTNVEQYLSKLKKKRHCWLCGREVQGQDIYYKHYPSELTPYYTHIIQKNKEDIGMLDMDGHVTLCTACGSVIEKQSDHYATLRAQEVRNWAQPIFSRHDGEIISLWNEIRSLETRIAFQHR